MSAPDDELQLPPALIERLRASLPDVGPTRRLRLRAGRANSKRPELLRDALAVCSDLGHADLGDLEQRKVVIDQLRALARRLEELP